MRLEVIDDFPGDELERGRLYVKPWPLLEAPHLHLERARDREGGLKLLGAPAIGGGSARAGKGGGRSQRSQIRPQAGQNLRKGQRKWAPALIDLKIAKNIFYLIFGEQDILPRHFLRNMWILNFLLIKAMLSYSCSKFWKSYMPPVTRIRVEGIGHLLGYALRAVETSWEKPT